LRWSGGWPSCPRRPGRWFELLLPVHSCLVGAGEGVDGIAASGAATMTTRLRAECQKSRDKAGWV